MIFHPSDLATLIFFSAMATIMLGFIIYLFTKLKINPKYLWIFLLFLVISCVLSALGTFQNHIIPLLPIFFGGILVLAFYLAISEPGKKISEYASYSSLILFQAFRFPLELILHKWANDQVIPITMTWSGQNFDIIAGILALTVFKLADSNQKLVILFQIAGIALLLNVIRVATMSLPLPFSWPLENPLQLPFHFPYVLIGPLFVGPAVFGHILIARKLLKK